MRLSSKGKTSDVQPIVDKLCIQLLIQMQEGKCPACGDTLTSYQMHHKRYGEDITLYDLELICGACHSLIHGIKGVRGIERIVLVPA